MVKSDWDDEDERRYLLKRYQERKYRYICGQYCAGGLKKTTLPDGRIRIHICEYEDIAPTQAEVKTAIRRVAEYVKHQLELGQLKCQTNHPRSSAKS